MFSELENVVMSRRSFCAELAATMSVSSFPLDLIAKSIEPGLKPLVKYRGGKSKEIAQFKRFIPCDYDTYFEPFVGGGATFFNLMPKKAVIGDINKPLIDFYLSVRDNYESLRSELDKLQAQYEKNQAGYRNLKRRNPGEHVPNANETLYYDLRDQFNGLKKNVYSRAALYFFINKTSYSGMIRHNSKGHFNVPFGRYEHFNTKGITQDHVRLLQRTKIYCSDYEVSFKEARANDFMFLDPPYDCVFNDYGNLQFANGFDETEHRRLSKLFRQLKCRALMVIGHTPLTEELYGDLVKAEYSKNYAVNIRNRFRAQATHYVVTNYTIQ